MKRLLLIGSVFVASLLVLQVWPSFAAKDAPVKIGIIDTQKILREAKAAKIARDIFLKDLNAKRATLVERRDKVGQIEKDLKNTEKKLSAVERKEKSEKLAKEVKELKRLGSDLDEEMKKKNADVARKLVGEIRDVARTFLKDENYTVILEKGTAVVVASDDAVDVTDKIIKLYDTLKK